MDKQRTNSVAPNPLKTQLLAMRLAVLCVPLYLFTLSPTCGVFGPYLFRIDFLLRVTLVAIIPGMLFSLFGVMGNSSPAIGISGAALTVIIVSNTAVELYLTVFDFTLLLFYLEISTTLNSFSEIVNTIKPGTEESVSYNYRLVINAYVRRLLAVILVTLTISLTAVFFALNFVTQIGGSGITVLSTLTLILVFSVIAARYRRR